MIQFSQRQMNRPTALFVLALLFGLGVVVWATDFITLKGEWTIYTVECQSGSWQHNECSGTLVPSKRYRFRALTAHNEVLFWTARENGPSGKYSDCTINDGREWSCRPNADAVRTITHQMVKGRPIPDPRVPTIAFHHVQKWKWAMLRLGIPVGHTALE